MTTEQEQARKRLAYVLHLHHRSYEIEPPCETCKVQAANAVGSDDITVTLPPEPQWKPGQYAWVTYGKTQLLVERDATLRRWNVVNEDSSLTDDEVTDVEPVVVLDSEDIRLLSNNRGISAFREFFAERGVDVR